MFELYDNDYAPMDSYPFAWRWTDRERVRIPADELRIIRPLTGDAAERAYGYAARFQGENYRERFRELDEHAVDGRGPDIGIDVTRDWLTSTLPDGDRSARKLVVSWTERMAVSVPLKVFIAYWQTFCYPVEDVVIWPDDESWVLLFDYKQRFYFARALQGNAG